MKVFIFSNLIPKGLDLKSYKELKLEFNLNKKKPKLDTEVYFTTNLDFFSLDYIHDENEGHKIYLIEIDSISIIENSIMLSGGYIYLNELETDNYYTLKEIRRAHNTIKIYKGDGFKLKPFTQSFLDTINPLFKKYGESVYLEEKIKYQLVDCDY